eukprot:9249990-Alexandrium_andersonii.AAC.1
MDSDGGGTHRTIRLAVCPLQLSRSSARPFPVHPSLGSAGSSRRFLCLLSVTASLSGPHSGTQAALLWGAGAALVEGSGTGHSRAVAAARAVLERR